MFRFYLNNILVDNAINWNDFTETIEYDSVIKGLLPKYETKLTFTGDGYDYIFSQYKTVGFCNLIEFKVEHECSPNAGYETILNGLIFISDAIFNLNKCTVDCTVMDNNYGAKIFNNKSIKAFINVGRSKNDVAIFPCSFDLIRMFAPSNGAYNINKRRAYNIKDAFRFLVDFMSDGTVGFESTFLSTVALNWNAEGTRLMTGTEMRLADKSTAPFISFAELFREVDIKYPLGFTIITVAGKPTIKIENEAYFKNATTSITVANIQDLKQSFNSELLYSKVKFGSTFLDYDGLLYLFKQTRFFNFAAEEYHLQGECNIDKTLDLTGNIISDTNIIEGMVASDPANDTYDDELFFVQINSSTLDAITNADPITLAAPFYYNDKLLNNKIAERYNLQGNIALYLGNNDDTFRSESTVVQDITADFNVPIGNVHIFSSLIAFQNDSTGLNYDTNNNYSNTLFKFVSPASGSYSFESNIIFQVVCGIELPGQDEAAITYMNVVYFVYDSGGGFLRHEFCSQHTFIPAFSNADIYNIYGGKSVYVPIGGWVTCRVSVALAALTPPTRFLSSWILTTSYFLCSASANGGGVYPVGAPGDYFISKFEFDSPLSQDKYDLLKADLTKAVVINHDGKTNKTTWIRRTQRKLATGEMKWEQISSKNNS